MGTKNLHDLMLDMTKTFDSKAVSSDFVADIQFHITGNELEDCYFHIENGKCTFHKGIAKLPKATINTPSEVWQKILTGEMNVQLAFFGREFTVEGDLMLLIKLASLFKQGK
jgi:putative sterol carrier protein